MILRPYQQEAVDAVYNHLRNKNTNPCVVLPTGCHAKDHPILMYDGSLKPVQDIAVGDLIMGPDSTPRRVTNLCRGRDEMFRVKPVYGTPFVVNGDHVLSLACTSEGKHYPSNKQGGEIDNISVKEYLGKSKYWRHLRKLRHVSVDFSAGANLPIPPYILGLLLGDGCLRDVVELTTIDSEVEEAWREYVHSIGYEVAVDGDGENRCPTYRVSCRKGRDHFLKHILEEMGLADQLSGTKFIPQPYLTASRQDRLLHLAGIMDADGHLGNGYFDYVTKSRELAADVTFLARSLGFRVKSRMKYGKCQNGSDGWFYRLSICGDVSIIPCRLKRKQALKRQQKKNVLRTGLSVEPVGADDYYGFTLDGDHLYVDGYFMVHHNSGKTPVLATICRDAVTYWDGRILVLAHVKELLQQAADKLQAICPDVPVGVYSAGLGSRNTTEPVIVAGIQSVYQKADVLGHFDLIIVDEAHLLPPDGEGMYQTFLRGVKAVNPNVRLIGLTATPYRLKSGMLCGPDNLLNEICYEIGVKELIVRGYLCPLKSRGSELAVDTSDLHLRGGEFVPAEVEALMGADEFEKAACREIVSRTKGRSSVLVFAASVERAEAIQRLLSTLSGEQAAVVTGETPSGERNVLLRRFKGEAVEANLLGDPFPPLKFLVNVNVLTTGFDAPNVDCVVLLRPTASPGLYYQMVGRGFRLHESKSECLILDYGNNITRHGPVDAVRVKPPSDRDGPGTAPAKECPKCHLIMHAAISVCSECGFELPKREAKHERQASGEGVVSGEVTDTTYTVFDTDYSVHTKWGATDDVRKTVRVDYVIRQGAGFRVCKSEWVCPEHDGWARKKFEDWWNKRSNAPPPDTAQDVVEIAESGGLLPSVEIVVRKVAGEKYDRIIKHQLADESQLSSGDAVNPGATSNRVCGDCFHYSGGYCCHRQENGFNEQSAACNDYTEVDDVPF